MRRRRGRRCRRTVGGHHTVPSHTSDSLLLYKPHTICVIMVKECQAGVSKKKHGQCIFCLSFLSFTVFVVFRGIVNIQQHTTVHTMQEIHEPLDVNHLVLLRICHARGLKITLMMSTSSVNSDDTIRLNHKYICKNHRWPSNKSLVNQDSSVSTRCMHQALDCGVPLFDVAMISTPGG